MIVPPSQNVILFTQGKFPAYTMPNIQEMTHAVPAVRISLRPIRQSLNVKASKIYYHTHGIRHKAIDIKSIGYKNPIVFLDNKTRKTLAYKSINQKITRGKLRVEGFK